MGFSMCQRLTMVVSLPNVPCVIGQHESFMAGCAICQHRSPSSRPWNAKGTLRHSDLVIGNMVEYITKMKLECE